MIPPRGHKGPRFHPVGESEKVNKWNISYNIAGSTVSIEIKCNQDNINGQGQEWNRCITSGISLFYGARRTLNHE
jgi:hypothetical protein